MKNAPPMTLSYAQSGEDIVLRTILQDVKKGFYIDVGANHPVEHSVTKLFYNEGWRGINVEPNPRLFELVKKDRPKDINLNIGVANQNGTLKLRLYHSRDGLEGLSTFSDATKRENDNNVHADNQNYSDIDVPVKKLSDIFQKHAANKTVHFMKVDVEGFEYDVLSGNNWKKFRPHILCIEFNHLMKDWRKLLKDADYNFLYTEGLNQYYVAKEVEDVYATKDLIERIIIANTSAINAYQYKLWQADIQDANQLREFTERQQVAIDNLQKSLDQALRLSLSHQPYFKRLKRALYGLTVDWLRYKKNSK